MINTLKHKVILNKQSYEEPIVMNQYNREVPYKFILFQPDGTPYNVLTTDIIKLEILINTIAIIKSTGFTINNNEVSFTLDREISLNSGKGTFNLIIENSTNNSRVASFKRDIVIEQNSISEGTIPGTLVITAIEELDNKINEVTKLIQRNADLINTGGAATKADLNIVNNRVDVNTNTIKTLKADNYHASGFSQTQQSPYLFINLGQLEVGNHILNLQLTDTGNPNYLITFAIMISVAIGYNSAEQAVKRLLTFNILNKQHANTRLTEDKIGFVFAETTTSEIGTGIPYSVRCNINYANARVNLNNVNCINLNRL